MYIFKSRLGVTHGITPPNLKQCETIEKIGAPEIDLTFGRSPRVLVYLCENHHLVIFQDGTLAYQIKRDNNFSAVPITAEDAKELVQRFAKLEMFK